MWKDMIVKAQTASMLSLFDVIADYLMENALYFFRERIEAAFSSREYAGQTTTGRTHRGKNDTIFERLDSTFTEEMAMQQSLVVKGSGVTSMMVKQMLKNWKRQGLVVQQPDLRYTKISTVV